MNMMKEQPGLDWSPAKKDQLFIQVSVKNSEFTYGFLGKIGDCEKRW
jgi:hypothetical protein